MAAFSAYVILTSAQWCNTLLTTDKSYVLKLEQTAGFDLPGM